MLLQCTDAQIISAVENYQGHLPSALQSLVPSDIPMLGGYYHPLKEELERRQLMPILHLARLRILIEGLKEELTKALEEFALLEAEVSKLKKGRNK